MRKNYTIHGCPVKVINRTPAKVTYIRISDGERFVMGAKWFEANAKSIE